jgi:hypothetical protein
MNLTVFTSFLGKKIKKNNSFAVTKVNLTFVTAKIGNMNTIFPDNDLIIIYTANTFFRLRAAKLCDDTGSCISKPTNLTVPPAAS